MDKQVHRGASVLQTKSGGLKMYLIDTHEQMNSGVDPHWSNADPVQDPQNLVNADPDPVQ